MNAMSTSITEKMLLEHLTEDVLENAAVLVVGNFFGRVHARERGDCFYGAIGSFGFHRDLPAWGQRSDAFHVKNFVAGQAEGLAVFPWLEFQREHPHAYQVAAVNSLEAFREDGANTEKAGAFGG